MQRTDLIENNELSSEDKSTNYMYPGTFEDSVCSSSDIHVVCGCLYLATEVDNTRVGIMHQHDT